MNNYDKKIHYPQVYRRLRLKKDVFVRYVSHYIAHNHPKYEVVKIDKIYAYCVKKGRIDNELH